MVVSTLVAMASMYIIRAYIANKVGIDGVGQFQAAWSISSLYLTAVLQAMGTDYFPRLSAVSENNSKVVTLVNEQTEIALLLAGPIVVGMLSFISVVVLILYSSKFDSSIPILHWMLAGTFFKVLSWPIGFIMLAKGRGGIFITTEIVSNSLFLLITGITWNNYLIESTGIAYVVMYIFYTLTVLAVGYKISGFTWSRKNLQLIAVFSILIIVSLINVRMNVGLPMYLIGGLVVALTSMYSLYKLNSIIDLASIYKRIFHSNG
jgi:PST family polysaccharide transporter